jgi:hypothetical protein
MILEGSLTAVVALQNSNSSAGALLVLLIGQSPINPAGAFDFACSQNW